MKKLMIYLTVISLSLFIFAGCSPSVKEQRLEVQNKNLHKDLAASNQDNKELKSDLSDLKVRDDKLAIRNQTERTWNQSESDDDKMQLEKNKNELADNQSELARNKNEIARNQSELAENKIEMARNQAEIARITKINEELNDQLSEEIRKGYISIEQKQSNLAIHVADRLFFASGSAVITSDGKKSLNKIGNALNKIPDRKVRIEGHTDDVPIGKDLQSRFPSNWELSAARAVNVVKYLSVESKVDANRISAAAFGQFNPLASNSSEEGRSVNRRIEILVTDYEYNTYSSNP
jgi:chemotaxis protein MotB